MMFASVQSVSAALVLASHVVGVGAFVPSTSCDLSSIRTGNLAPSPRPGGVSSVLHMISTTRPRRRAAPPSSSASSPSSSSGGRTFVPSRSPKRTVSDRTQREVIDLIRDVTKSTLDAEPRSLVARHIQAHAAFVRTAQDFLPVRLDGTRGEEFRAPVALRKLFERLGATYVKLGQFIASSPTLFPAEYVLEFQKCLDATEPLDWSVVKNLIEKELGPISNTFLYVDKEPLASASIAQVHSAILRTGEDVVIKVQKPRIDASLKTDLSFLYVASRVIEFLQPDLERTSLSAIVGDIRTSMLEELDFEKEATNVEKFRQFILSSGLDGEATAPKVYRQFTTKKVMTMEKLDGVSLLDAESVSKITSNPEIAIITALNVWTMSVMQMPFFHADVHAGNLLMLKDGRVGFIDFGIVGRVSPKTFRAVEEMSTALALGDYEGMARALTNMGAADEEVDIPKFGRDIERVMVNLSQVQPDVAFSTASSGSTGTNGGSSTQATIAFDEEELSRVMLDIVDVTENNGLKLPREFGLLVKQSLYFDRYLKILAPTLDVMSDSRVQLGSNGSGDDDSLSTMGPMSRGRDGARETVVDIA